MDLTEKETEREDKECDKSKTRRPSKATFFCIYTSNWEQVSKAQDFRSSILRIFLGMKGSQPGSGPPRSFWCLINVLFAEYANVNKCIKKTYCNLPPAKAWKDQNIYFVRNNEIKPKTWALLLFTC